MNLEKLKLLNNRNYNLKNILVVFFILATLNSSLIAQNSNQEILISTDLAGNAIIRIQLLNDEPLQQMITLNSCRYGKLNFSQVSKWKDLDKITLILNNQKLRNFEDVKFKRKNEMYFDFVVIMDHNDETYLIIRQGDRKYLSQKIDPVFCTELDDVLKTQKEGC